MRLLFLLLAFLACSCSPGVKPAPPRSSDRLQTTGLANEELLHVNSVAIMPPIFERRADNFIDQEQAALDILQNAATARLELEITSPSRVTALVAKSPHPVSTAHALKIARDLGADAVIITHILEYRDRLGSSIGVTVPASISFAMSLQRSKDGAVLWSATYVYRDQALSENLLALTEREPHGISSGWRTASALLRAGFEAAFRDIGDRRRQVFISRQ